MNKEKKDKNFLKKPVYPGGNDALKKFIRQNIKYPEEAIQSKIEGTVRVNYTINHKGIVIDSTVVSKLGYGCDDEAKRLVSLLKFKVEKPRGVKVKFHKNINIYFKLPKKTETQVNYTITKSKKTASSKPKSKPGYSYTIDY